MFDFFSQKLKLLQQSRLTAATFPDFSQKIGAGLSQHHNTKQAASGLTLTLNPSGAPDHSHRSDGSDIAEVADFDGAIKKSAHLHTFAARKALHIGKLAMQVFRELAHDFSATPLQGSLLQNLFAH